MQAPQDHIIDDIPFLNTLIIDNQPDDPDVKALEVNLKERKIWVTIATNSTEAESILKLRPELDIVIIDWVLSEDNDMEAKTLIDSLKDTLFAPIIIYTDQGKAAPERYLKERKLDRVIRVLDKADVKGDRVFDEIEAWLTENPELKIFMRWAHEVNYKVNETLWTIHDLEIGGLRTLVELLEPTEMIESHSHITREQDLINFFDKVLARKISIHEKYLNSIKNDIEAMLKIREKIELDIEKMRTFHSFERYKPSNPKSLWTGSILKEGECYYIVVTPPCDLSNKGKIENILMVKAEPLSKYRADRHLSNGKVESCLREKTDCVHYLPYAIGLSDGLICRFDSITCRKEDQLQQMLNAQTIVCLATVDSPFIENLMQRMNSYLMRLGVRSLDDAEISRLSSEEPSAH
jgi:hypothetical protein